MVKETPQNLENLKYFNRQLLKYMEEQNVKQVDLVEALGIPKTTINGYVKGKSIANPGNIQKLADYFHINKSDIDLRFFEDYREDNIKPFTKNINNTDIVPLYTKLTEPRQTKVYNFAKRQLEEQNRSNLVNMNDYIEEKMSGYLSAGTGEYLSDDINEDIRIPKSIVPDAEYDLILQVNGDSMEPMFEDHEYIFVKKTTEIRSGQIGVFIIDNESYLKKAYIEDNHLRLVSLNTEYDDLIFDDVNEITVVGTVVM